jgi:hypothetical protein
MKKHKPYDQMTTAELANATKRYDKPFAALKESKPLTATMRRMHRIAAKRGRPRVGKGAAKLYISMERGLLKQADHFARIHGMSRSQLISQGIRAVLESAA